MSMHLLPIYVTSTNMKKRKQKKTKRMLEADAAHAKFLKKMGYKGPVVQRSERAAHNRVVAGSNPAGPTTSSNVVRPDQFYNETSAKQKPNVYSGERRLLGIATMHKSNLQPIWSKEQAKDAATMRRN